jgi:hypothetical protein
VRPHRQRQEPLLQALRRRPAHQVLDLEGAGLPPRLHPGGALPDLPQPSQKHFDTRLWQALRGFDPAAGVRGKRKRAPSAAARARALLEPCMRQGHCLRGTDARPRASSMLLDDYAHFAATSRAAAPALTPGELRGRERVTHWQAQARAGEWPPWSRPDGRALRPAVRALDAAQLRRLADAPRVRLQLGDAGRPGRGRRPLALLASAPPLLTSLMAGRPGAGRMDDHAANGATPARWPSPGLHRVRPVPLLRPLGWLARGWPTCCAARCRPAARAGQGGLRRQLIGGAPAVLVAGRRLQRLPAGGARWWPPGCTPSAAPGARRTGPTLATALRPGSPRDGRLVVFGLLLALAGTGWVLTSASLITGFAGGPVDSPADFLRVVVLARDGWLFEAWLLLGGVLAAPVFASSVVAIPCCWTARSACWRRC